MKKRQLTLVLFLFLFSNIALAQTEKAHVVNAGAGNVESGNFNVTYFIGDYIGFDSSSEQTLITELGEIKVFPNPVNTILNISTSISDLESLKLFNVNGILVKEFKLESLEVDLSEFPDGVYLLKFFNKQLTDIGSIKLVKQ